MRLSATKMGEYGVGKLLQAIAAVEFLYATIGASAFEGIIEVIPPEHHSFKSSLI